MHFLRWCRRLLLAMVWCWAGAASALSLSFTTQDLSDGGGAADLWQLDFSFEGELAAFHGFSVSFDATAFSGLAVSQVPVMFTPLVFDPDPVLGVPGIVQMTAEAGVPANTRASFSVQFTRLGALPTALPFDTFDDSFNVVATGVALAVPEPSTALMLVAGGLLLARRGRPRTAGVTG